MANMENWKEELKDRHMRGQFQDYTELERFCQRMLDEPMGVSEWKEYGKKYKYWDYFVEEIIKKI